MIVVGGFLSPRIQCLQIIPQKLKQSPSIFILYLHFMIRLLENTRRHDITFNRNGQIRITARIVRLLGLSSGDAINIAANSGEYLLYAIHDPFGRHQARCYPSNKRSHNFVANSAKLARALLDSCNITSDKAEFMIGEPITIQDKKYLPIITARPIGF